MCTVSMVSDHWTKNPPGHWPGRWPGHWPPLQDQVPSLDKVTIDLLRKEVERLKKELEEARKQDIRDNNPDCHMEDKVAIIKGLAKALGVDLGKVFEGHK